MHHTVRYIGTPAIRKVVFFAVSHSFFGDRTPFLQHAAIAASMAVVRPLDSLADVDMVDVAWVFFVPRPSA